MPSTIMVNQLNSLLNNSAIAIKSHLDFQNTKDLLNVNNLKVNTIDINSSMIIGGNITMGGSITIGGNITISGNLSVLGSTVSIKSVNLEVQDKNIELSKIDSPTDAIADGGGITLKGTTDKTINWNNAQKSWISSESFSLALNKTFKINNIDVLTSTQVLGKTLPSGIIVGTSDAQDLTNKTINGFTYPIIDGTNGQVLITNGSKSLTFTTINQNHNNFTNIMGGTIGNYYHSNQPINSTDSPTFANLTVNNLIANESVNLALSKTFKINNIDVLTSTQVLGKVMPTGIVVGTTDAQNLTNKTINGFTYPVTDGTNGQVLTTNGTKGLTFTTSLSAFIKRSNIISMDNDDILNLIDFFGEEINGYYILYDISSRMNVIHFLIQVGATPSIAFRLGGATTTKDSTNANPINIYRDSVAPNNYKIENKTRRTIELVGYRYV